MPSNLPVIKQGSALSFLIQTLILVGFYFLFRSVNKDMALFYALAVFLVILFLVRYFVPIHHRRGIIHYRRHAFDQAIPHFEKSYAFFLRHSWLDRWRFIFILSSSKISYTEMALLNIAFCKGQTGDKQGAIDGYNKALEQFPESQIAVSSLRMLQ